MSEGAQREEEEEGKRCRSDRHPVLGTPGLTKAVRPPLVAGMLQTKAPGMDGDISDDELKRAHDKVNNSGGSVGSNDIGNAAALGAIKNVLSGSGDSTNGGSSGFQEKLVGAAMAHAGTLFDQRSNAGQAEGTKEDAMHKAGEAVMKLLIKNQMTGMIGGGSSGGLGQLAKLVM